MAKQCKIDCCVSKSNRLVPFSTPTSTPTPQNEVYNLGGLSCYWNSSHTVADRAFRGIGNLWVGFRLVQLSIHQLNPNLLLRGAHSSYKCIYTISGFPICLQLGKFVSQFVGFVVSQSLEAPMNICSFRDSILYNDHFFTLDENNTKNAHVCIG